MSISPPVVIRPCCGGKVACAIGFIQLQPFLAYTSLHLVARLLGDHFETRTTTVCAQTVVATARSAECDSQPS
jgi:hypothetical protein